MVAKYFVSGTTGCYEAKDEPDARQFRNIMGKDWQECSHERYLAQKRCAHGHARAALERYKIKHPHIDWESRYPHIGREEANDDPGS